MSISKKYGRTQHFDFSPGTTSDDRINWEWRTDILRIDEVIDTEKLDGENNCLNEFGVFSRSHAAPSRHHWVDHLKPKFSLIRSDLKNSNIEIFGENLYAQHSIIYPNIDEHFYVFAIRQLDMWLSWDEVKWYSEFFEYPTVPVLNQHYPKVVGTDYIKDYIISESKLPSTFGSLQNGSVPYECTKEGIVTRNIGEYKVEDFKQNVFKYVRKGHVTTDAHWSRNWKRAPLQWERKKK